MEILLTRIGSDADSTIGVIHIDGSLQCFSLEDEYRAKKVWGETRIPAGRYRILLRTDGSLHQKYKEHKNATIRSIHRGMLWLQDVPGFEYILIHIGNNERDTAGCILTGAVAVIDEGGPEVIQSSTLAYIDLYRKAIDALNRGEQIWITVRDYDLAVKKEQERSVA